MATEQGTSTTAERGVSSIEWASWIVAVLGLWTLVSPFVLSGEFASGAPMYSNVVAGLVVAALAGFTGYTTHTSIEEWSGEPIEWGSWIAALAGLWLLVSPFALSGEIGSGAPMYSNVLAGLVVLVLGAYAGWTFRSE